MESIVNSLNSRIKALKELKDLFINNESLESIELDYELEAENDNYIGISRLKINETEWTEEDDEDGSEWNSFNEGDITGITSELLNEKALILLQDNIQSLILMMADGEGLEGEIILRREIILSKEFNYI